MKLRSAVLVMGIVVLGLGGCAAKQGAAVEPAAAAANDDPTAQPTTPKSAATDANKRNEVAALELDPVFFEFDSAALTTLARQQLTRSADALRAAPETRVTIEGHCDETGTVEYNLALGDQRAKAAQRYLVSQGVSPNRLRSVSYGETRPATTGTSPEAHARNRRSELVVTPDATP